MPDIQTFFDGVREWHFVRSVNVAVTVWKNMTDSTHKFMATYYAETKGLGDTEWQALRDLASEMREVYLNLEDAWQEARQDGK